MKSVAMDIVYHLKVVTAYQIVGAVVKLKSVFKGSA